jgi:hypothetical protein
MKKNWTREEIMAIGNITASDVVDTEEQEDADTEQEDTGAETDAQDGADKDAGAVSPEVAKLRRENAGWRVKLREQETKDAAFRKAMAKALGIGDDTEVDADKLTGELTAAQATARQKDVELAVFKAAAKAGVDGDALLDSRSFLASVADLDPSDADFSTAVTQAVTTAAKGMKTTTARKTGGDFSAASGGGAAQWSEADLKKAKPEDVVKAREKGLLNKLMGQ